MCVCGIVCEWCVCVCVWEGSLYVWVTECMFFFACGSIRMRDWYDAGKKVFFSESNSYIVSGGGRGVSDFGIHRTGCLSSLLLFVCCGSDWSLSRCEDKLRRALEEQWVILNLFGWEKDGGTNTTRVNRTHAGIDQKSRLNCVYTVKWRILIKLN